ncbi:hypothetical protein BDZ97DRAFT_1689529, partial [Flammula alnicola]
DPWKTCHGLLQEYDSKFFKAQTDEVQYLLIFAGLFSAVVTSFAVDLYKMLQQDSGNMSAYILSVISTQLGNGSLLNQTLSPPSSSPNGPVIRINIFWFVSLSLSLTTVLLGTTCMQWLREYRHFDSLKVNPQRLTTPPTHAL